MSEQQNAAAANEYGSERSLLSMLSKLPWTLLLIIYLMVVEFIGLSMDGVFGYLFIIIGVVVLFVEFFKSGDISTTAFLLDLISSVVAVVIATALLTWLWLVQGSIPGFFHWMAYTIIIGDAIVSPYNSFRTALRNFGVG